MVLVLLVSCPVLFCKRVPVVRSSFAFPVVLLRLRVPPVCGSGSLLLWVGPGRTRVVPALPPAAHLAALHAGLTSHLPRPLIPEEPLARHCSRSLSSGSEVSARRRRASIAICRSCLDVPAIAEPNRVPEEPAERSGSRELLGSHPACFYSSGNVKRLNPPDE